MKVCLKINIPARYLKVPNNMFPVSKSLDCEFHGNLEAAAAAFQLYFHTTPPPTQLPRETSTVWHLELLNFYINIFRKLLRLWHLLGGISSSRQLEKACLQYMIMYATPSPKLVKSSLKLSSDKH